MLVECANRTEVRTLQTAEPQTPTPSSDSETIVGETTLQSPKNDHHGEDTGKQCQEIQSRQKIKNKLSITIPSLSPHIPNQEFPSTRPSSEAPKDKIQEGNQPLSAPSALSPSQPETTIYIGSPVMNPRNRPASAFDTQTIRDNLKHIRNNSQNPHWRIFATMELPRREQELVIAAVDLLGKWKERDPGPLLPEGPAADSDIGSDVHDGDCSMRSQSESPSVLSDLMSLNSRRSSRASSPNDISMDGTGQELAAAPLQEDGSQATTDDWVMPDAPPITTPTINPQQVEDTCMTNHLPTPNLQG
ncbi:hypothetical protein PENFLA_c005G04956 [Penicillium flavigenum]|uniref:Uncharacterized protein n=1 Tax=Penicillium flavigenum TaxID=254877 RepID=A0A1V6TPC5_9EURO|nr:hypothetical protein PENFLA_c005G04956 [Penicillium flavigenum]